MQVSFRTNLTIKCPARTLNVTCSVVIISQSESNKDHQRMMVDPMFMIVQSLRSFLTAVTPTAVAPIAVILPVFT